MDESKLFSILLDETTDVSHIEVSFVVRFVHQMETKERFLQVWDVTGTAGKELENVVMTLVEGNGLKLEDVWGQGYDGAANMSGSYKDLHLRI